MARNAKDLQFSKTRETFESLRNMRPFPRMLFGYLQSDPHKLDGYLAASHDWTLMTACFA